MLLRMVVMTMEKRSAALACSVVALGLALVFGLFSPASARPPATSGPVIACFHPEIGRFTAQARPSRCHLRGYREKRVVGIPIEGMKWGHWGANPTRAAYGVNERSGYRVRIIAFQPIACEGRTWYSRVTVVTLRDGNFYGLRLPTCDGPSVID
jgi:hypothetical protein